MLFQAGANNKSQNTSSVSNKPVKPKHRCKRLLIICGVVVVVAVVILISLAIVCSKKPNSPNNYRPNSPEDIMVRYLRDK